MNKVWYELKPKDVRLKQKLLDELVRRHNVLSGSKWSNDDLEGELI